MANDKAPARSPCSRNRWGGAFSLLLVLAGLLLAAHARWLPLGYDDAWLSLVAEARARTGRTAAPLAADAQGDFTKLDHFSGLITTGPALNVPASWVLRSVRDEREMLPRLFRVRGVAATFSLLSLVVLYLLGKSLLGPAKAFWAAALLAVNVQFLSYGSLCLGEAPGLLGLLLAAWGLVLQARNPSRIWPWLLLLAAAHLAVLSKAYFPLPLGLGLGLYGLWCFVQKNPSRGLGLWAVAASLPLSMLLPIYLRAEGDWTLFWAEWRGKSGYTEEFLALELGRSLRFWALKPLGLVGTALLLLRWKWAPPTGWVGLAWLQVGLLVFFFLSVGFDRFGLLTLALPSLALAEWVQRAWRWVSSPYRRRPGLLVGLFIVVFALGAGQRSLPRVLGWLVEQPQPHSQQQQALHRALVAGNCRVVYTADIQAAPLLPQGVGWRVPPWPPSQHRSHGPLPPPRSSAPTCECLLLGPFTQTEFGYTPPHTELVRQWTTRWGASYGLYGAGADCQAHTQPSAPPPQAPGPQSPEPPAHSSLRPGPTPLQGRSAALPSPTKFVSKN